MINWRSWHQYWQGCLGVVVGLGLLFVPAATRAQCVGDCNLDAEITIDELVSLVNISLGSAPLSGCPAGDADNSGDVTVDEIVTAVNNSLNSCPPPPPTPTPTTAEPTVEATATPTTAEPTATATEIPPTATPTEVLPTDTPTEIPPTDTPTEVPPTDTPTEIPPTATPTATSTPSGGIVTGRVRDRLLHDVPNASVVLIDAAQVAASAVSVEEPLATLALSSLAAGVTGADGRFSLSGVAPGSYFVYVAPQPQWLPGGSLSRAATQIAVGPNDLGDIMISQQPSSEAVYKGSSYCLLCHRENGVGPDASGYKRTLHAMTYRVPGVYTANQDPSPYPGRDRALVYFPDGNASDNTGAGDGYGYLLTNISTAYDVLLGREDGGGRYFAVFRTKDGTIASERYYVEITFGGEGIWKQRFITRIADGHHVAAGQGSYYILPIQFDESIQENLAVNPVNPWLAYNAGNWPAAPSENGGPTGVPTKVKSFDLNCAGCHFTGTKLTVDAQGNFRADAVDDPNGVLDYDGDGTRDEIVQGCEDCHGPGSEHTGQGPIIQPQLLSAERSAMICGQCHVRGEGKGTMAGAHTEYPSRGVDANIEFPRAGISRAEFKEQFHEDRPGQWPDGQQHAKSHHQQYHDHIRSTHYRNPFQLLACDSCHTPHDTTNPHNLIGKLEDNSACLRCHAPFPPFSIPLGVGAEAVALAVERHMSEDAYMVSPYDPANALGLIDFTSLGYAATPFIGGPGNCATCHMPKTAKSQGQWTKENGRSGTIMWGDISSHQFAPIWPSVSSAMKLAGQSEVIPNSCGVCHNALTDTYPDLVP
ncbi:MAG: hypothetical protein HY699_07020 [Deltaproteobacteria bacterium]|nr:hypothetical protein [Deltaproteobacteria bacterium]